MKAVVNAHHAGLVRKKAVAMLTAGKGSVEDAVFADLAQVMADASICSLGHAAANPLRSALRYFPGSIT